MRTKPDALIGVSMKMVLTVSFVSLLFSPGVIFSAQEDNFTKQVVDSVTSVCRTPDEKGKHWEVEAIGKGDVNLKLLRKIPGVGVEGKISFSKGEWEGVQRVLRDHQASENADYRQCVRELTPLFMKQVSP